MIYMKYYQHPTTSLIDIINILWLNFCRLLFLYFQKRLWNLICVWIWVGVFIWVRKEITEIPLPKRYFLRVKNEFTHSLMRITRGERWIGRLILHRYEKFLQFKNFWNNTTTTPSSSSKNFLLHRWTVLIT